MSHALNAKLEFIEQKANQTITKGSDTRERDLAQIALMVIRELQSDKHAAGKILVERGNRIQALEDELKQLRGSNYRK